MPLPQKPAIAPAVVAGPSETRSRPREWPGLGARL